MNGGRYLIVKLSALGDVAMASTLPGAIRARDANAHVTWLCGGGAADLVRLFAEVNEVVVVDERSLLRGSAFGRVTALVSAWRLLAGRRFDEILMAHADRRFQALVLPVRASRVRRLSHGPSPDMLPIPGRYHGDEYIRLLDDESRGPIAGHAPLADVRPFLPTTSAVHAGVVLVPGGARNVLRESALKRWPIERYRDLATRLRRAGITVTLVGDAADAWVRPHFDGLDVHDRIGAHDVVGTLGVLNAADLVIAHDTGPMHLARLVRAPLIALFGPTTPSQFVIEDAATSVIWGGASLACRPCYDGREFAACSNNLCMQDIPVAAVADRALAMLARHPSARPASLVAT
ncbi:MAG TPA: glycosyltransferase family 9 protein [Gemmatimonadaceae bacterium]|nr:glycosyltransferase family 9 protein [Gemmatimonadaceae bacterium]